MKYDEYHRCDGKSVETIKQEQEYLRRWNKWIKYETHS